MTPTTDPNHTAVESERVIEMEDNLCPKPTCGKPESTTRKHAGKTISICDNGHGWDAQEEAAKKAKAQAKTRMARIERFMRPRESNSA